jgi:glycosyltransferase involved in cell wall biosynthesis
MKYFSIILTTFNRNNLIKSAINSILNQTYKDWECIIIDDGSEIPAINVIKDLIKNDKRFSYIYQENRGVAGAKNRGLFYAKNKYVTFIDSDDYYLNNHLESRKEILEKGNYDLVYGGFKVIGDEYVVDKLMPENKISIYDCIVGGTFFIKNEIISKIGGFEENIYSDDSVLFEKIKDSKYLIKETHLKTYIYNRIGSNSVTKNIYFK